MSDAWYCAHDGRTIGPFPLRDLKMMFAQVPHWRDLPVWREGFGEWRRAGEVEELAGIAPSPRPRREGVRGRSATAKAPTQDPVRIRTSRKVLGGVAVIVAVVIGGAFGELISRTPDEPVTQSSATTADDTPQETARETPQARPTLQGQSRLQEQAALPEPGNVEARTSLQEQIAKGFDALKGTLPKRVDDLTTMISAKNDGTEVTFGYRLEVDGARLNDDVKAKVRELATKNICAEKQSRAVLDLGGSFELVYTDINGQPVATVGVAKDDCP
jgi:GYF domain 2